jgi:hypothetical protein
MSSAEKQRPPSVSVSISAGATRGRRIAAAAAAAVVGGGGGGTSSLDGIISCTSPAADVQLRHMCAKPGDTPAHLQSLPPHCHDRSLDVAEWGRIMRAG